MESNLSPSEIYRKRQELGLKNSYKMLSNVITSNNEQSLRREAIKYLGSFKNLPDYLKNECFNTLENVLISDKNIDIRCEAANSMGKLRIEKALKPLKWILNQSNLNYTIVLSALKAISEIQPEPNINIFIKYLGSEYNSIREFVKYKLLDTQPERLIPDLINYMDKKIPYKHKSNIVKLIGDIVSSFNISYKDSSYLREKYPNIINELMRNKRKILDMLSFLDENKSELKKSIIIILKILRPQIDKDILLLLDNDDYIVKTNAINILGELEIKAGIDWLLKNLDDMYHEVSIASIKALGKIGEPKIIPDLLKALDIDDYDYQYIDYDMKWYIIDSIKDICIKHKKKSCDFLVDKLQHTNDIIKENIAFLLGDLRNVDFVKPLLNLLRNSDNLDVRKNAIIALGKISSIKALNPLMEILENVDTYWLLKKVAVDAIFNIYSKFWDIRNKIDYENKRLLIKNRAKIIDILKNHIDECHKIKVGIIKFLERFGDKTAIHALIRVDDFKNIVNIAARRAIKTIDKRIEEQENLKNSNE